ncbi:TraB family protein [Tsuneonella dongtanensis]|uniref:TraB family protein n=1 Tax=Tsuneonella dongtanensis TaxID=692370 RepID=A0A1B2AFB1_9SPHN|nr:TraB/GumN family protein [Tsuneonella dongtanensis]ANY20816.1 TraB family protein [Tsuneonella dongtanensis]
MTRLLAGLLALFALAACGKADTEPELPPPDPALWEITLASGEKAGWLFGTIHSLPEGAKWRTPAIDQAIVDADLLVVEVKDLDDSRKLAATFTRLSHAPDGLPPLAERVPTALRERLRALIAKGGYREADFKATETWAAALTLAQLADDSIGENGVDRALVRDFKARRVEELEGIEGQFRIFDTLPEADQRDLLGAVVEEDTMTAPDTAKLAKLWLAGDMEAIAREGDEGMLADPELREALLTRRNRDWAEAIGAILAKGERPLVAVGAAHMAPPAGLPELLAAKGYTVRRVR